MNKATTTCVATLLLCSAVRGQVSAPAPDASKPPAASLAVASSAEPPSLETATTYLRQRKSDAAATEFQRVIDAGMNAPAGYAGWHECICASTKQTRRAGGSPERARSGAQPGGAHVAMAEVDFRLGKIEDAAEEFRRLIKLNTSDPRAYFGMSRVMRATSNYQKMKLLLDRTHELDPKDPDITHALATTLCGSERIRAIELEMNSGRVRGSEERLPRRRRHHADSRTDAAAQFRDSDRLELTGTRLRRAHHGYSGI